MKFEVLSDEAAVARTAAQEIAAEARAAVAARGRSIVALSGGRMPDVMFRELAAHYDLP